MNPLSNQTQKLVLLICSSGSNGLGKIHILPAAYDA